MGVDVVGEIGLSVVLELGLEFGLVGLVGLVLPAMEERGLGGGRLLVLLCKNTGLITKEELIGSSLCSNCMMDGAAAKVLGSSSLLEVAEAVAVALVLAAPPAAPRLALVVFVLEASTL